MNFVFLFMLKRNVILMYVKMNSFYMVVDRLLNFQEILSFKWLELLLIRRISFTVTSNLISLYLFQTQCLIVLEATSSILQLRSRPHYLGFRAQVVQFPFDTIMMMSVRFLHLYLRL